MTFSFSANNVASIRKTKKNGKFTKREKYSKSEVRPKKNSPCPDKATSNSEKIKPVALAVIELRLSEGISQSVTYSVSRKFR